MQGLITSMNRPVTNLTMLGARLQETTADLARLRDVENYPVPPAPVAGTARRWRRWTGHLRIEGLTFGYNPLAKPLIDGLDLDLPPGSRVALVGGSGSGKSTIGRLVGRPVRTLVRAHNDRRQAAPARSTRTCGPPRSPTSTRISCCSRERSATTSPSGTRRSATTEIIIALTRRLRVRGHRPAPRRAVQPGRGGRPELLRGQRQRLEIARALVRRPALLILDEATSALDAETELAIDRNLRRRGATCLIIAHRLSTVRDCDLIMVLGSGGELERGIHEQLLANAGPYAELISEE